MAVVYKRGSIFDSNAECIVNATNSVGVMGAGLARAFKDSYPVSCDLYNEICQRLVKEHGEELMDPWIDNIKTYKWHIMMFATKINWRHPSKLEYIETGMPKATLLLEARGIKSCAWPLLGTGLGGLKIEDVLPIMEKHLNQFEGESEIWIYE